MSLRGEHSLLVRPRSPNKDLPFYSADKDFSLQGLRIVNEIQLAIQTRGEDLWYPRFRILTGTSQGYAEVLRRWDAAGKVLCEFVADTRGEVYVPGTSQWSPASPPLTWEQSIDKVLSHSDVESMTFLLSIAGHFMLDAFFAGERQAGIIGAECEKTYAQLVAVYRAIHAAKLGPESNLSLEDAMVSQLRATVSAAITCGLSSRTIERVIWDVFAKELGES